MSSLQEEEEEKEEALSSGRQRQPPKMLVQPKPNYDDDVSCLSFMSNSVHTAGNSNPSINSHADRHSSHHNQEDCQGDTKSNPSPLPLVANTCDYDDKGRCVHHPRVRLRKRNVFGRGWKVLISSCPECLIDHMRRMANEGQDHSPPKSSRQPGQSPNNHQDAPAAPKHTTSNRPASESSRRDNANHSRRPSSRSLHDDSTASLTGISSNAPERRPGLESTTSHRNSKAAASVNDCGDPVHSLDDGGRKGKKKKKSKSDDDGGGSPRERQSQREADRVSRMPWIDARGRAGVYTGDVNKRRAPCGHGTMEYESEGGAPRKTKRGVWKNGKCRQSEGGGDATGAPRAASKDGVRIRARSRSRARAEQRQDSLHPRD